MLLVSQSIRSYLSLKYLSLFSIKILLKIVFQDVDTACIKLYCRDNPTKLVDFLSSPASYSCDYEDCLSVLKEFQRFGSTKGCGVSSFKKDFEKHFYLGFEPQILKWKN